MGSTALDDFGDVDAVVTWDVLVPDPACNAEPQACRVRSQRSQGGRAYTGDKGGNWGWSPALQRTEATRGVGEGIKGQAGWGENLAP